MAKGQNHQIVKTPRDCPGIKHQNFEKKNSLHCFLYPSTTFKKLKPKIQNEVVFLKRPRPQFKTENDGTSLIFCRKAKTMPSVQLTQASEY